MGKKKNAKQKDNGHWKESLPVHIQYLEHDIGTHPLARVRVRRSDWAHDMFNIMTRAEARSAFVGVRLCGFVVAYIGDDLSQETMHPIDVRVILCGSNGE